MTGPLGEPVEAGWRLDRRRAVIEMAEASGLELAGGPEGNDPVAATTTGTGELIAAAVEAGARRVLVGVGGSATTDGGLGALRGAVPAAAAAGHRADRGLRRAHPLRRRGRALRSAEGRDRGAGAAAARPARAAGRRLPRPTTASTCAALEGAGAAGGLAGGLAAVGARLESGFEVVADEVELFDRLEHADLVITGEGFLDAESFDGKVVGGVVDLAAELGIPVLAIAGRCFDGVDERVDAVSLVDRFGEERSMTDALGCIEAVVADHLARAD